MDLPDPKYINSSLEPSFYYYIGEGTAPDKFAELYWEFIDSGCFLPKLNFLFTYLGYDGRPDNISNCKKSSKWEIHYQHLDDLHEQGLGYASTEHMMSIATKGGSVEAYRIAQCEKSQNKHELCLWVPFVPVEWKS